ncbi:MAG: class I SAM-dependent methyltransferase [Bacteroidia bacterium]|nr:class I SAM-dependent methyltransferase [Bacteroidia bacterium]
MNFPFEQSSFWNERFGQQEYVYGREPNAFLREYLEEAPAGRLLLPGEGEGRNAVFASTRTWEVEAVDFSEEGRKKALNFAEEIGVRFDYKLENIATYQPEGKFDLIAFIFIHPSPSLRRALFRRYLNFLKPGGKLLFEAFSERQFEMATGGPKLKEFLYTREELEDIFRLVNIEKLTEQEVELQPGPYREGSGFTLQMLASMPSEN